MNRNISPPPPKRRKTATQISITSTTPNSEPLPVLAGNGIRIFSWNINGISPFLQKSITSFFPARNARDITPPASLRGFLQRHDWPSILFLQEVKIAANDTKTQSAVSTAVNCTVSSERDLGIRGPEYKAHFTLPNDLHNARGLRGNGKVYGVCSILRADLYKQYGVKIKSVDWDKEGRISIIELQSNLSKLAIFNIYAVNGTDNPYRDPKTGVIQGTRHDRMLKFQHLLSRECFNLEGQGWDVILAGDMNVAPDMRDGHPKLRTFPHQHVLNRIDFHEKLLGSKGEDEATFRGIDVWRKIHEDERRYTWFPRTKEWGTSCDRVDYVIVGQRVWDKGMIKACGIMDSETERGPSDHCPIWVDIELI